MEKVFMGLGILFIVLSAILFIAFVISIICDSFKKKSIAQRRAEVMQKVPMRIVEVSNQDTIGALRMELNTYKNAYGALLQEMRIKKEEPIQGIYCRDCKNNVSSIACKANVKCKLFEGK